MMGIYQELILKSPTGLGCAYSITNVQANVLSYPGLLSWHYGRGTQRHKVANHWESEESIKVGAQHSIT